MTRQIKWRLYSERREASDRTVKTINFIKVGKRSPGNRFSFYFKNLEQGAQNRKT
jgi:hypothetical protein